MMDDGYRLQSYLNVTVVVIFILQIKNLTNQAQRNSGAASIAVDELRQARSRLDAYNSKIGELESANAALLVRVCPEYTSYI
jgi:lamin B